MHISKPCRESYAGMPASEGGRHCNVCSTPVVDFTKMSIAEIDAYFKSNAGRHICGRYKASQVSSDALYSRMLWAVKGRISSIRATPLRMALLAMVSVMFTLSNCIMGKRVDPGALKRYNDESKDSTIRRSPADTVIQHN